MSPGDEKKKDTVNYMLRKFKASQKIKELLEDRFSSHKVILFQYAYITRKLSRDSKKLIEVWI